MSKFTQGTWRASYEENKYIWSSDDQVLGELYFTTPEETKANARLIANSPDMYDLLEDVAWYLEQIADDDDESSKYASRIQELLERIDGEVEDD